MISIDYISEINFSFCGYGHINKEIENMIATDLNYDVIYITDISPSEEILENV